MVESDFKTVVERAGLGKTAERYPEIVRAAYERAKVAVMLPPGLPSTTEPAHVFVVRPPGE